MSKRATLRLLDELDAEVRPVVSIRAAPATLAAGDFRRLLPESAPERGLASAALEAAAGCETGLALYAASDSAVAVMNARASFAPVTSPPK